MKPLMQGHVKPTQLQRVVMIVPILASMVVQATARGFPIPQRIGAGLGVVPRFTVTVEDEPEIKGKLSMEVVYDNLLGRFVPESVTLSRHGEGDEVTSVNMRALRIQEYLREAVTMFVLYEDVESGGWVGHGPVRRLARDDEAKAAVNAGPVRESLQLAARIYQIAKVVNMPPAKAVADQLGLAPRTAAHWIAKARAQGLLD